MCATAYMINFQERNGTTHRLFPTNKYVILNGFDKTKNLSATAERGILKRIFDIFKGISAFYFGLWAYRDQSDIKAGLQIAFCLGQIVLCG